MDLAGANFQDAPHAAAMPSWDFGNYGTIDNNRTHPRYAHTAAATFVPANMDTLNAALASHQTITYVMMDIGAWNAEADRQVSAPYGGLGGCSYPLSLVNDAAYLAWLLPRYPKIKRLVPANELTGVGTGYYTATADAGADTVTLSAGASIFKTLAANSQVFFTTTGTLPAGITTNTIYYIKTTISAAGSQVTQISLTSGGAAVNITDAGTGVLKMWRRSIFNWYELDRAVDLVWSRYQAAKAARPDIDFTTPSVYDPVEFAEFLDAVGPISGKRGRDIPFDSISLHPYGAYANLRSGGMDLNTLYNGGIEVFTKIMTDRGYPADLPVHLTEMAPGSQASSQRVIDFNAGTVASRKLYTERVMHAAARNPRIKTVAFFSVDNVNNLTGPMREVGGSGDGIGAFQARVPGKTLLAGAGYAPDGTELGETIEGGAFAV